MQRRALIGIVAAVTLAACGTSPGPTSTAGPQPPRTPTSTATTGAPEPAPSPTTTRPSAAPALTAFFAAARDVDQRLRAAAQRVNAEIGTPAQFSPATLAAISAASPERATALLPGGMPRELQQPVLAVVNDLVSRFWAFRGVGLSAGEAPEGYLVRCLAHGAQPAARFAADLQTAETAAESSAAFPVAQPDSRAAAEIAVYVGVVVGTNSGCMSCGGGAFTPLPPIVWHRDATAPGGPTDGTVGGVAFRASYQPVGGWRISFLAC